MKMNKYSILLSVLTISIFSCQPEKTENVTRGHLLLIGGKDKPAKAIERFIELCDNGPILVIPSASAVPHESDPGAVQLFLDNGAKVVDYLFIAGQDSANDEAIVEKVRQARGIFFTGGVQTRLMKRIGFSKTEEAIRDFYFNRNGVIGGTSAGAAVMSEVMITGDGDFTVLHKDNIATNRGLGFLQNCIIDQHFVKRQRNNRLISVTIESGLPGIGIDESTAIIYNPDDTFEVYGEGSVIVYDPRKANVHTSKEDPRLAASDIRLTILRSGQFFDLISGSIQILKKETE